MYAEGLLDQRGLFDVALLATLFYSWYALGGKYVLYNNRYDIDGLM
jgi:hypothetical protein